MTYLILALIIWASSFVAGKAAFEMLDPVLTIQLRLLLVSVFLLPVALKAWKKIDKKLRPQLWGLSFLNYTAVFLLQFLGLNYTSAASAATVVGVEPLLVVFVGCFLYKEETHFLHWVFGGLAFIGVSLLVSGDSGQGEVSLLGCALVMAAGLIFTFTLRTTQRFIARVGPSKYTPVSIVLSTIACIPFSIVLTQDWHIHWSWKGTMGIFYLAFACSWLAYWLWNKGVSGVNSNTAGMLTSLEPIFGVFLAMFLLGEQVSLLSWVGIIIIVFAASMSGALARSGLTS